jgi:hypothetical protein
VISIASSQTTTISPILIPKKPLVTKLNGADAAAAAKIIASTKLPTDAHPLLMGCVLISVSNNRVIGKPATSTPGCATPPEFLCSDNACEPTLIYPPAEAPIMPIRGVIPVPGRTDALVIAAGLSANVIGIDPRTPQYFAPVVRGTAPTIGVLSIPLPQFGGTATSSFYLSDQGNTYLVKF